MGKKLYFGGPILTMRREQPVAGSLLVEDGVIIGVDAAASDAERIDLKGRTLMPSFIDGHSHMAGFGLFLSQCDLTNCTGFDDLLERIRSYRDAHKLYGAEPIRCRGYDPAMMQEGQHPTAKVLDTLGVDNPIVCVHRSGHVAVYNSVAMRLGGLNDSYVCPFGGAVGRDENGHLTGYFEEAADRPLRSLFPSVPPEKRRNAILQAQSRYLSHGITTVQDGTANGLAALALYEKMSLDADLIVDVVAYMAAAAEPEQWQEILKKYGNRQKRGHWKLGGVKLFLDGSPQARTAWMLEPYAGETEYRGYPKRDSKTAEEIVCRAAEAGLQVLAHCNGDAACGLFVSAWEKAVSRFPDAARLRPVMVHAQTVTDPQLERMAPIGMMPSFFIGHCWYWGDTHLKNLGEARGSRISPAAKALELGLPYSFHQDAPVTEPDMLHSVWCAVNRVTMSGRVLSPAARLKPYDALIGATRGCAYSYFEENTKGVLQAGAAADLIVLDQDPTAVDPMTIRDISVLQTIKDGETVYER